MIHPPFHRRILPWLFLVLFLILAPVLILYTSGYRYNAKKGQLERNGTLIADSTPPGAKLFIDGSDTGKVSPVTLQDMTPGWHTVRLVKTGYVAWEKSLEVRAEQAVFANDLWLWRDTTGNPTLVQEGPIRQLLADPTQTKLAMTEESRGQIGLTFWTPMIASLPAAAVAGSTTSSHFALTWSDDGQTLLLQDTTRSLKAWWASINAQPLRAEALPNGTFHWSGNDLLGKNDTFSFRLDARSGAFSQEPTVAGILEQDGAYALHTSTSTHETILTDGQFWKRSYSLPSGSWSFGETKNSYILLRSGASWLAILPSLGAAPFAGEVTGDAPRWLKDAKIPNALFLNQNEIWQWQLGAAPQLLWRQSEPIVQVAWHRSGGAVFVATAKQVFALDLDERNGRLVTPLTTFDQVTDMAVLGKEIYVAGTKNGMTGLWRIDVE